jgi:hypothetical protein
MILQLYPCDCDWLPWVLYASKLNLAEMAYHTLDNLSDSQTINILEKLHGEGFK